MSYVTGNTIRNLREKHGITQKKLAEIINVSDKTVSKWETNKGLPDIGIIEELAKALGVSVTELLTGDLKTNENVSGNMKKVQFYICPICGNIITAVGEGNYMFFVKCFSLKKASEFPFFSMGFSLLSAGIMHPCA